MTESDVEQDEIIEVRLPRHEYLTLREVIKREQSISWVASWVRNTVVWWVGGAILAVIALWDSITKALTQ